MTVIILLYLLDANILINANQKYYGIEQVREYWDWLSHQGTTDRVKIPREIYDEITAGNDNLSKWIKDGERKQALLFKEEADVALVRRVMEEGYERDLEEGYERDLNDSEVETIGKDAFLIAYALADPKNRTIVTAETSKPNAKWQNRKVPDVCDQFDIFHCDAFEFGHALGFTTRWEGPITSSSSTLL